VGKFDILWDSPIPRSKSAPFHYFYQLFRTIQAVCTNAGRDWPDEPGKCEVLALDKPGD
jgi:hypothetical protein